MLWLVGEQNDYFRAVADGFSGEESILLLSEAEAVLKLEPYFDDSANLDSLSVVTFESCSQFLERVVELVDHHWISFSDRLALVILSETADWTSSLAVSCTEIFTAFGYRKPLARQFDVFSVENTLLDFAQRGKLRLHIVLLGELFGRHGYKFVNVFKSIYSEEFQVTDHHERLDCTIPLIHCNRFAARIRRLVTEDREQWPVIISGFDWDNRSILSILREYNRTLNSAPESSSPAVQSEGTEQSPTAAEPTDAVYTLLKAVKNANASHLQHLFGSAPSSSASSSSPPSEFGMTALLTDAWGEFLNSNGLQPVYVFVAGPPKSCKTEHAQVLADRLKIARVDLHSAVLFALQLSEEKINAAASRMQLRAASIVQFQKELTTAVEAKLNEGKKGKDKAAPSEGKVDISLVSEAMCLSLPPEFRKKAVGLFFAMSAVCQRRGCVWDIWDKGCVEEVAQIGEACQAFDEVPAPTIAAAEGECPPAAATTTTTALAQAMTPAIHAVVELQCDEKWLLGKYNDYLTAQQVKPKEAQAMVKTMESTLPAYFGQLQPVGGDVPLQTHSKVKAFLGSAPDVAVVRPVLSSTLGSVVTMDETAERTRAAVEGLLGKAIGWLPPRSLSGPSDVAPASSSAGAEAGEALHDGGCEEAKQTSQQVEEPEGAKDIDPVVREKLQANVDKVSAFLSNTILPTVARAVVEVMRDKPEDPIMYVANFLSRQSEQNQSAALEFARNQFYEILQQGTM